MKNFLKKFADGRAPTIYPSKYFSCNVYFPKGHIDDPERWTVIKWYDGSPEFGDKYIEELANHFKV